MVKRQVFFSFEYNKDNWRAGQIRNMGKVDDNSTFSDNDWEEVKEKTNFKIKEWIDSQLEKRSCLVVLIGTTTSTREWVKYEIEQAYKLKKGIVGIYIHKLKDKNGNQTLRGNNPFYSLYTNSGERLSNYVKTFDSIYNDSTFVYKDIEKNIENLIENAIKNSGKY